MKNYLEKNLIFEFYSNKLWHFISIWSINLFMVILKAVKAIEEITGKHKKNPHSSLLVVLPIPSQNSKSQNQWNYKLHCKSIQRKDRHFLYSYLFEPQSKLKKDKSACRFINFSNKRPMGHIAHPRNVSNQQTHLQKGMIIP